MKLVTREQWGARPARFSAPGIHSEGTTGHWEGTGVWPNGIGDHASCATKVRAIQAYHMDHHGWSDIAYNAVACPHGYVFEGRGPGRKSAANGTATGNARSAVVCYMGGIGDAFTAGGKQAMIDAAEWLEGDLRWGHRDWKSTQCPGDEIYNWIHSGASVQPGPVPITQGVNDMAVGQCRDKAPASASGGPNRKWFFYVGEDMALWAKVYTDPPAFVRLGGIWTSGVQALCETDGRLVISGRAADGQLQQCIVYTDGNTIKPPGTPPEFELLGGKIYPPM